MKRFVMQFADVTNDVAFRKVFGDERYPEVLLSFLNCLLELKEAFKIIEIDFRNPYQLPNKDKHKESILDIKVKDKKGKTYIIEMQVEEPDGFENRVQYYTNKDFVTQIKRGEDYPLLNAVIFIGIINFNFFSGKNYLTKHLILNKETLKNELKGTEYNFIELKKFDHKSDALNSLIAQWVYFIKCGHELTAIPKHVKDKGLKKAYQLANMHVWTDKELEIYDVAGIKRQDAKGRISKVVNKLNEAQNIAKVAKEKALKEKIEKEKALKLAKQEQNEKEKALKLAKQEQTEKEKAIKNSILALTEFTKDLNMISKKLKIPIQFVKQTIKHKQISL